jgi:hypothetical protein
MNPNENGLVSLAGLWLSPDIDSQAIFTKRITCLTKNAQDIVGI